MLLEPFKFNCSRVFALFCLAVAFNQTAALAFNKNLVAGASQYYAGKYAQAYQSLYLAIEQEPNDAESHELMGLVLEKYKRFDNALHELDTAARLDPSGEIGLAARQEAAFVRAAASPAARAVPPASPVGSPSPSSRDLQSRAWLSSPQVQAAAQALDRIDSQAQSERQVHLQYQSNVADTYNRLYSESPLQRDKEITIKNMQSVMVTDIKGHKVPVYTDADIARVRNDYDERIAREYSREKMAVQQAQDKENGAAAGVDQTVAGLRSQFATASGSKGGLLPGGTNLFVRNYLSGSESNKPKAETQKDQSELEADQYKLVLDKVRRGGKPVGHIIRDPLSATGSPNDPRLNVNGRMLPVGKEQP